MNKEKYKKIINDDGLLSTQQYADKYGITKGQVYNRIEKKRIPWSHIFVIDRPIIRIDDSFETDEPKN